MLSKDKAICIRTSDYSETSQIVVFFTRTAGRISAIAKGSKRPRSPFDGPIEIFSNGQIVFTNSADGKLCTLTEFKQQLGQNLALTSIFNLNCASFAAELITQLTDEYDPHPGLFDSFLQFLENAAVSRERLQTLTLLILFQLGLLKEVGLQPVLNICVNCKNRFGEDWVKTYFSSSANGLVCRDCEAGFPDRIGITKAAANCLGNLKLFVDAEEKTLNEIERLLVYHFTEQLGKMPKMAKHVLE